MKRRKRGVSSSIEIVKFENDWFSIHFFLKPVTLYLASCQYCSVQHSRSREKLRNTSLGVEMSTARRLKFPQWGENCMKIRRFYGLTESRASRCISEEGSCCTETVLKWLLFWRGRCRRTLQWFLHCVFAVCIVLMSWDCFPLNILFISNEENLSLSVSLYSLIMSLSAILWISAWC